MPINLLHETPLNDFLIDVVYQGGNIPKQPSYQGNFKSPDYVEQHRDEIVKGILLQYIKLRLRGYMTGLKDEPAFVLVDKTRQDLPGWTAGVFAHGDDIYEFEGSKMSDKLRDDITTVRDYLYDVADQYVGKVIETARRTEKQPKIRYDYLKTTNEFDTFDKALAASQKWHENMAEELAKRNRGQELLQKSLIGVKHIMDLPNKMVAYQLLTSEALDFESEYMGHCVGKGGYDTGVKDGSIKIYSIRDEHGEPHATLEVRGTEVHQVKGKSNKAPIRKYVPPIKHFIEAQHFDIVSDYQKMGLIKQDGKLYDLFNLPIDFKVVKGNLNLGSLDLTELPDLSAVVVNGGFWCSNNQLTSLQGCPKRVGGGFWCGENQLTSLAGAPQSVGGDFSCSNNQLTSLDGAPQSVGGSFWCSSNQLTSLHGAPKSAKKYIYGKLENPENMTAPRYLQGKDTDIDPDILEKMIANGEKQTIETFRGAQQNLFSRALAGLRGIMRKPNDVQGKS